MDRVRRALSLIMAAGIILMTPSATTAVQTPGTDPGRPTVVSGSGDIKPLVDLYRNLLGPDNGGEPGSRGTGRREINWDGVPDELAAPTLLPGTFFNDAAAPRARGAMFSTPGTGVQVSARRDNPAGVPVRFGHLNPSYSEIFPTFSPERLFSPLGSNVVDMTFRIPGTDTPALTRGFGAVYADVDLEHTAFEYFDRGGNSLGRFPVPVSNNGLSFLGVVFDGPIVARVQIVYGNVALGPDDGPGSDVAVMDDFIYGEPVPYPAPAY
jgi:hypothetical protein